MADTSPHSCSMAIGTRSSTREYTPLGPELVGTSPSWPATPWSDVLLGELRTTVQFQSPPILIPRYGYISRASCSTRLRNLSRFLWIALVFAICLWWALDRKENKLFQNSKEKYTEKLNLDGLQFVDANHPNIRFVGRWLSTSDGTLKEASFPGVYLDFSVVGSTTVLVSLHNAEQHHLPLKQARDSSSKLSFLPLPDSPNAAPISLLARVDEDEYNVLPNATSIVTIRKGNLDKFSPHNIRIIAPMVGSENIETIQVKGIWIDDGAELVPDLHYQSSGGSSPRKDSQPGLFPEVRPSSPKMLEVVTDLPGFISGREKRKGTGSLRSILGGVMGWEYLLGDMFESDHVTIGMDGMCLIPDCIGGRGSPAGLADVFFQSGPTESKKSVHSWSFQGYVPDVIVMNIGNADWDSFQNHNQQYNKTLWELSVKFEETYVAMLKAIRTLAYPKYSRSTVDSSRYIYSSRSAATGIPIFIMRPFRGQLEQATHTVVDRLRYEGDRAIFWLDTSGWLNTEVDLDGPAEDQDFFLDEESSSKQWRLTERGNQKVAILLHMHVCRYLARDVEKCAFLPPESYSGQALDPEAIQFNDE